MKKAWWILIGIGILLVIGGLIYWISLKGARLPPDDFLEKRALGLYEQKKSEGMIFNNQCLGVIEGIKGKYAVDIVHVPRTDEDNLIENQCEAYRSGEATHFIELDKDGNVVRVV